MFILHLKKLATTFTAYNTAPNVRDTALHYLRPVATEYILLIWIQLTTCMKSGASPGACLYRIDVADLKRRLTAAWSGLQERVIDHASDQQRGRLCACVRIDGRHLERLVWSYEQPFYMLPLALLDVTIWLLHGDFIFVAGLTVLYTVKIGVSFTRYSANI